MLKLLAQLVEITQKSLWKDDDDEKLFRTLEELDNIGRPRSFSQVEQKLKSIIVSQTAMCKECSPPVAHDMIKDIWMNKLCLIHLYNSSPNSSQSHSSTESTTSKVINRENFKRMEQCDQLYATKLKFLLLYLDAMRYSIDKSEVELKKIMVTVEKNLNYCTSDDDLFIRILAIKIKVIVLDFMFRLFDRNKYVMLDREKEFLVQIQKGKQLKPYHLRQISQLLGDIEYFFGRSRLLVGKYRDACKSFEQSLTFYRSKYCWSSPTADPLFKKAFTALMILSIVQNSPEENFDVDIDAMKPLVAALNLKLLQWFNKEDFVISWNIKSLLCECYSLEIDVYGNHLPLANEDTKNTRGAVGSLEFFQILEPKLRINIKNGRYRDNINLLNTFKLKKDSIIDCFYFILPVAKYISTLRVSKHTKANVNHSLALERKWKQLMNNQYSTNYGCIGFWVKESCLDLANYYVETNNPKRLGSLLSDIKNLKDYTITSWNATLDKCFFEKLHESIKSLYEKNKEVQKIKYMNKAKFLVFDNFQSGDKAKPSALDFLIIQKVCDCLGLPQSFELCPNYSAKQIKQKINEETMPERLKENTALIIYFAAHGQSNLQENREYSTVMTCAYPDDKLTTDELKNLILSNMNKMSGSGSEECNLFCWLLLDVCRGEASMRQDCDGMNSRQQTATGNNFPTNSVRGFVRIDSDKSEFSSADDQILPESEFLSLINSSDPRTFDESDFVRGGGMDSEDDEVQVMVDLDGITDMQGTDFSNGPGFGGTSTESLRMCSDCVEIGTVQSVVYGNAEELEATGIEGNDAFAEPGGLDGSFAEPDDLEGSFAEPGGLDGSFAEPDGLDGSFAEPDDLDGSFAEPDDLDGSFAELEGLNGSFVEPGTLDDAPIAPGVLADSVENEKRDMLVGLQQFPPVKRNPKKNNNLIISYSTLNGFTSLVVPSIKNCPDTSYSIFLKSLYEIVCVTQRFNKGQGPWNMSDLLICLNNRLSKYDRKVMDEKDQLYKENQRCTYTSYCGNKIVLSKFESDQFEDVFKSLAQTIHNFDAIEDDSLFTI